MGSIGERLAIWYVNSMGLDVMATNLRLAGGEIDVLASDGPTRVAIEVRTLTHPGYRVDPIDAIDPRKRERVGRLGRSAGAARVDLIGISLSESHFDVHWVPDAV